MDALLVGPKQILPVTHTRYSHCVAVQSEDTLKYFNKETACVCNDKILFVETHYKTIKEQGSGCVQQRSYH